MLCRSIVTVMSRKCSFGKQTPNIQCGVPGLSFKSGFVKLLDCQKETQKHLSQLGLVHHPVLKEYELILSRLG